MDNISLDVSSKYLVLQTSQFLGTWYKGHTFTIRQTTGCIPVLAAVNQEHASTYVTCKQICWPK